MFSQNDIASCVLVACLTCYVIVQNDITSCLFIMFACFACFEVVQVGDYFVPFLFRLPFVLQNEISSLIVALLVLLVTLVL